MGPVRLLTYRVDRLDADAGIAAEALRVREGDGRRHDGRAVATRRSRDSTRLADEFGVNVAVLADSTRPGRADEGARGPRQAARHRHRHRALGAGGRLAARRPGSRQGSAVIREPARSVRARAATHATCRSAEARATCRELFNELNRLNVRPLSMTLDTTGVVERAGGSVRARSRRSRTPCSRPTVRTSPSSRARPADPARPVTPGARRDADAGGDPSGEATRCGRRSRPRFRARPYATPKKAAQAARDREPRTACRTTRFRTPT